MGAIVDREHEEKKKKKRNFKKSEEERESYTINNGNRNLSRSSSQAA
jgi:hypothetical protein